MSTRLIQIMALFYRMAPEDEASIANELLSARKRAWATAIRNEARAYGCNQVPNAPRGNDLNELKRMSEEDAKSIAATFNRQMEAQFEKLFADNRRGNRYYYAKRMEAWVRDRNVWKSAQISVTTDTQSAEFARRRFFEMNDLQGEQWIFSGPPPTCRDCTRRFAAGIVTWEYTLKYPAPRHIACPHSYRPVQRQRVDCKELWIG